MKANLVFLISWGMLLSCSSKQFHIKKISEISASSFESIKHVEYCFYKTEKIGPCSYVLADSSGRYAVIQDSVSGYVYLYDAVTGFKKWLNDEFVGFIKGGYWEDGSVVLNGVGEDGALIENLRYHITVD